MASVQRPLAAAAPTTGACWASCWSWPLLMFGFGYALVPMYRAICEALGINVLSLAEQRRADAAAGRSATRRST